MIEWRATYRCDEEEYFCTETHVYHLETTDMAEAARLIGIELGGHATLIVLERIL